MVGLKSPIAKLTRWNNSAKATPTSALPSAPTIWLAMIANRMVGALGSALVGVAFALLFHLVNFAIGLFSPTIHALRLHYVEFFGEFYSPGGATYRPLAHWRPASPGAPA